LRYVVRVALVVALVIDVATVRAGGSELRRVVTAAAGRRRGGQAIERVREGRL
jgi:hypothetical protein